jgi:hypothetical protein
VRADRPPAERELEERKTLQAHRADFTFGGAGAEETTGRSAVRSPFRISMIALRIAIDANPTRGVRASPASSHPSNTATTGFAYVCVATTVGGHRCSSQV